MGKKECEYCRKKFQPDPRLGNDQKACFRKPCKKKRKREAHANWLKNNPDAYKNRYSNVKTWRVENPEYQRQWRAENPDKVARDNRQRKDRRRRKKQQNAEIQDACHRRKIEVIRDLQGAEIQDTMELKIAGILDFLERPVQVSAEIQDSIGP